MNQKHTYLFEMNRIAIPLILSTVTSVLMGIIDQAFVGHISLDAYAGVGLVCSCVNSLVGVLGAFSIVFNITGARLRGADDEKNSAGSLHCLVPDLRRRGNIPVPSA